MPKHAQPKDTTPKTDPGPESKANEAVPRTRVESKGLTPHQTPPKGAGHSPPASSLPSPTEESPTKEDGPVADLVPKKRAGDAFSFARGLLRLR